MPRSHVPEDESFDHPERGSAALEFILVGLVLLVPIVYLVITLGLIQAQSLGVEAGARHVARAISTSSDAHDARARADLIIDSVVREYGLDASAVSLSFECRPAGAACPDAGAALLVTVRTDVPLPLVPPVLGLDQFARIPVEASAVQKVSRTWGTT